MNKAILGKKIGMTQIFLEDGRLVPVTVVEAGPCVVTQVRTPDTDGYSAVQLGFGAIKAKKVTKPAAGHYDKAGVTPRKHLVEERTSDASALLTVTMCSPVFVTISTTFLGRAPSAPSTMSAAQA